MTILRIDSLTLQHVRVGLVLVSMSLVETSGSKHHKHDMGDHYFYYLDQAIRRHDNMG